MSFLSALIGKTAVEPIEAVGSVITGIFGDKGEKLTHEEVMTKLAQNPGLAQTEVNKVEAAHRNIFVAGWRPFIGWVGGIGLANAFVLDPMLARFNIIGPELPLSVMMELVFAMLGIGTLRTIEKLNG